MSLDQFLTILTSPPDELLDILGVISTLGLVVVMFSLGLKINFAEIKKNFKNPKNLITGLILQIILLPFVGLVFALTSNFSTNIQLAIMIIACMPSAATSNFITNKINGNTSLSITLTSICTVLAVYTIPFYLKMFSLLTTRDISIFSIYYSDIIIKIFFIITAPVVVGMLLKYYLPQVKKIEKSLDKLSIILFIVIIKLAIYLSVINIKDPVQSFTAVLIFMSIIIISVFVVTKILNISFVAKKTIFAEALLQNNILGFIIIYSIGGKDANLIPVLAIYGVCQYLFFVLLMFTLLKNKSSIYISEKI